MKVVEKPVQRREGTLRYERGHLVFLAVTSVLAVALLAIMPRLNATTLQLAGMLLAVLALAVGWVRVWLAQRRKQSVSQIAYWTVVIATVVPVLFSVASELLERRVNIINMLAALAVIAVVGYVQYEDWQQGRSNFLRREFGPPPAEKTGDTGPKPGA